MQLLSQLIQDFPDITFEPGNDFHWSPKTQSVTYRQNLLALKPGEWTLLHELGHGVLSHRTYQSDLELLQLEVAAWQKAEEIAQKYGMEIPDEHIQNCLDSYRDWLHLRSTCPTCNVHSLQTDANHYKCLNCGQVWSVTNSRFCRPYRRKEHKKTSPPQSERATFA